MKLGLDIIKEFYNSLRILLFAVVKKEPHPNDFTGKQFQSEIILLNLRWYLRYALTYRDLVEMMAERGVKLTHTTIMRWVHEYSPIFNKRLRPKLQMTGDSWKPMRRM